MSGESSIVEAQDKVADRQTPSPEPRAAVSEQQRRDKYIGYLLKALPDIALVMDADLNVVLCTESYLRMIGLQDASPLIGKCPYSDDENYFGVISGRDLKGMLFETMRKNEVTTLEMECAFREGGDLRRYRIDHIPLYDDTGVCDGLIISFTDIHDLSSAIKRAEDADKAKSEFLATMSHEIRTPMNAVKGLSELLSLTELDSVQRNYVDNVISASNTLLGIVNDILDFSKITANRIDFIEEAYEIKELVASLCNVINVKAEDKGLLLTVDIAPNLPSVLYGDEFRIKQILTNILTNAVKYTHKGFVRLSFDVERKADSVVLICSVADSGIGIQAEDMPSLFEAFSRVNLQANRSILGTGLGLSIARQLAVTMGGEIDVQSVFGEGSIFTVRLPQKIVNGEPIAYVNDPWEKNVLLIGAGPRSAYIVSMLESLGVKGAARASHDIPGGLEAYTHCIFSDTVQGDVVRSLRGQMPECRFAILKDIRHAISMPGTHETVLYTPLFVFSLASFLNQAGRQAEPAVSVKSSADELAVRDTILLVVDDNEINRIVSSEMLGSFQAQVICAEDGYQALELCQLQKFDIIFMDHMMPGKDGIETTREIRRGGGPNSETPILALTANVVNNMKNLYLESGMNDCLSKPIELSDLESALTRWLPADKIVAAARVEKADRAGADSPPVVMSQNDLISAMDHFGLYSSDVMSELNGDFDTYVQRMKDASGVLSTLVPALKDEVANQNWTVFADDIMSLQSTLYGIGARDCAARSRQLSAAAQSGNIDYVHEDFFSLMGNMYMLEQKLTVIVPVAQGGNLRELPLGVPQYLHGCLEKLGRALEDSDAEDAMAQIAHTAGYSLDMDLDMALKAVKADLENNDFKAARAHYTEFFREYTRRIEENAAAE
ncbi:ATP-binding protein [Breznakiella homolactica]|uniref:histidine kinase n=1 Tax=Breznakiella homolactica TaxID=2798577 RepID=A0A7T7XJK1_9SPIR|nr:ATP-binding protein [Breznakiella homolactica]QQO07604.1 response regulator [Breznakiella homolactica]